MYFVYSIQLLFIFIRQKKKKVKEGFLKKDTNQIKKNHPSVIMRRGEVGVRALCPGGGSHLSQCFSYSVTNPFNYNLCCLRNYFLSTLYRERTARVVYCYFFPTPLYRVSGKTFKRVKYCLQNG